MGSHRSSDPSFLVHWGPLESGLFHGVFTPGGSDVPPQIPAPSVSSSPTKDRYPDFMDWLSTDGPGDFGRREDRGDVEKG